MQKVSQNIRKAYLRLCYAGLQEDMAQRIMFSTLPFLASPAQVAITEGVVDINALKAAVEGRKNIIKYGVMAVLGELENYKTHLINVSTKGMKSAPYRNCRNAILNGKFAIAMDIAIEAFKEPKAWYTNYGGRAWEMIARTIRQISRLDYQLDIVRSQSRSEERDRQELQLMRDLIVEMNAFDGLAHNSDSVLNNLAELEANESVPKTNPKERQKRHKENYIQLKRLMDAKELDSPVEVFKLIQDTLTGSGDVHKFKDWVTKMRNQREFRQTDPKLIEKLFIIYLRKALLPARSEINSKRDKLSKDLDTVEKNWDQQKFSNLVSNMRVTADNIKITTLELREHEEAFITQYQDLPTNTMQHMLQQIFDKANNIVISIIDKITSLESLTADMANHRTPMPTTIDINTALVDGKEILSLFNQFSYLLDTV